ncbi:MAG: IS3 family transposase, partial [Candidatus Competibacteraceae bacterium]|nr:IS3 family transposase [Candidatus Competibacteraceae bacterium]
MSRRSRRNHSPAFKASVFGQEGRPAEPLVDLKALHAKIGELTLENDFL